MKADGFLFNFMAEYHVDHDTLVELIAELGVTEEQFHITAEDLFYLPRPNDDDFCNEMFKLGTSISSVTSAGRVSLIVEHNGHHRQVGEWLCGSTVWKKATTPGNAQNNTLPETWEDLQNHLLMILDVGTEPPSAA